MGGFGSGRHGGRETTKDRYALDIRRLRWESPLTPGTTYIILEHQTRVRQGQWESRRDMVSLDWTDCHLGGRRAWFICPLCGRRVAMLYCGHVFACRGCHDLRHESQRENEEVRAFRRADNLRRKMGWIPGIAHGFGSKPKGMHWRTFARLASQYSIHVCSALAHAEEAMARARKTLGRIGGQN
ncbi:MAG: hypothetical protein LBO79_02755 [Zoogloeaceae bacterium]|jgi:hypothetical protein|nr:hypothetical protein [Zoogloeaceae bacterium]